MTFRRACGSLYQGPLVKDGHSTWDTDDVIAPQVIGPQINLEAQAEARKQAIAKLSNRLRITCYGEATSS